MKPARRSAGDPSRLTAPLRAAHRCVSVEIHPVFLPHAPCQPGASPASALTRVPPPAVHRVASRRSSLRFGRNTPGIPPSRALSAGRLAGLGAHAGSTTGCSPRRFAPLIVAFQSEYTRYSSLARLVSRAPRRPRRSRGFHHRLFTAPLRVAHRCASVEIHQVFLLRAPCQPDPHRENWALPTSALTSLRPQAARSL